MEAISSLMELGFSRTDAARALHHAEGDVDKAYSVSLRSVRPSEPDAAGRSWLCLFSGSAGHSGGSEQLPGDGQPREGGAGEAASVQQLSSLLCVCPQVTLST